MKKLLLSIAFLLPAMGMMAQTQVKTAEGILEGKDLSGITVFKGIPLSLSEYLDSCKDHEGASAGFDLFQRRRTDGR